MYAGTPQRGADGREHLVDKLTRIHAAEGIWLYDFCRELAPKATLEIGLAYGFSTIFFLAARAKNNCGTHTAVDPFARNEKWCGIGLEHGRRLGGEHFQFIEEPSSHALVRFARAGAEFEVIFIDGSHLFDHALLDFTLSAEVCPRGGHIILDDLWMPSIQRVAAFVRTNRGDFTQMPTPIANIAVFRRIGDDTRDWTHFAEFA